MEKIKDGYAIAFNEWFLDPTLKNELPLLLLISSLSAEKGFCFANNSYLAEKLKIGETVVSRKLKKLADAGHIQIKYTKRGCEIINREIYVLRLTKMSTRLTKKSTDGLPKSQSSIDQKVKDNNTSNINITSINKRVISHTFNNSLVGKADLTVEIVCGWNTLADKFGFAKLKVVNKDRLAKFKARMKDGNFSTPAELFNELDAKIRLSPFLRGIKVVDTPQGPERQKTDWQASFDFFMQASSFVKTIEGVYTDPSLRG